MLRFCVTLAVVAATLGVGRLRWTIKDGIVYGARVLLESAARLVAEARAGERPAGRSGEPIGGHQRSGGHGKAEETLE